MKKATKDGLPKCIRGAQLKYGLVYTRLSKIERIPFNKIQSTNVLLLYIKEQKNKKEKGGIYSKMIDFLP